MKKSNPLASPKDPGRRRFTKQVGAAAGLSSASCLAEPWTPEPPEADPTEVPQPPAHAKVVPTACDYCSVGCAYEAVIWPEDKGGEAGDAEGRWFSPNMHTVVTIGGEKHNVVVRPDAATRAVNLGGDHSARGGTLAQKLYREDRPTKERLKRPQLRLDGRLVDITWPEALELVARTSNHVIANHGAPAWGMKQFSYQYYENTYALTKLALGAIGTPNWTLHDKPAAAPDTPGLKVAGINAFSASYEDWAEADVLVVSGVSLYDAKSVLFTQWVQRGGAKLVVINPRRDLTAAYAEAKGGLHLQLRPGTDTALYNAIARRIIESGWQDDEFIATWLANRADIDAESSFWRSELGLDFDGYRRFLLDDDSSTIEAAAEITGVPAERIAAAAELIAAPVDGARPKTSFMLEKGNYWSHNVDNTSSYVSLGLLCGAGNRPGRVISRGGGHQRGMLKAASYPLDASPDSYNGHAIPLNQDRWVLEDRTRFMWVVGATWFAAMGASQALAKHVWTKARQAGPLLRRDEVMRDGRLDVDAAAGLLAQKADGGGMVLVQQEIYANPLTEYADLVLPAATWGEADFTRMQAERRLRIYSKIMDPPGDAKPDWWIVSQVAQRMGHAGFDWADENAVFEDAATASEGTVHDYAALAALAKSRGYRAHELLRSLGTTGIQCPIQLSDSGELEGTVRLHEDRFGTRSGRAIFARGDWQRVARAQEDCAPRDGEVWVLNMRVNALWQSMADDMRIPFRAERFKESFVEINPEDAGQHGIESGDWIELSNDAVPDQIGGDHAVQVRAVAYVTDAVPPGVTSGYFNWCGDPKRAMNSLTSGRVDPMNPIYRYKLGRARLKRIGPSDMADEMCFLPMNLV